MAWASDSSRRPRSHDPAALGCRWARASCFAERPVEIEGLRWTGGLSAEFIEGWGSPRTGRPCGRCRCSFAGEAGGEGCAATSSLRARLYLWAGGATRELVLTGTMDQPAVCVPISPGVAAFTVTGSTRRRPLLVGTALVDDDAPIIGPDSGVTGDRVADATPAPTTPDHRPAGIPLPTWFSAVGVAPGAPCPWTQHKAGRCSRQGSALAAKRGITRLDPRRARGR